ncbi:angiopoietin-related protein 6-like [Sabethes cyaneus]|uniref:angiopoietin-related protein 6-like n=1 Tax=Sabethes cyaneus TaxID=53552 RepID=UPI00237EA757|nr:angiopoietin-related protein 6-like [Sabethes cyaneus]
MNPHQSLFLLLVVAASSLGVTAAETRQYRSCAEAPAQSGVYTITVAATGTTFQAFCEQEKYGGGWLVFQNRYDGSVNFNRSWEHYKTGFGNLRQEFWLGLEKIHQVTAGAGEHDLLIVIENFTDYSAHEIYPGFRVENETEHYKLRLSADEHSFYGTAQDAFWVYRNDKFSTYDRINDISILGCAIVTGSGYWHYDCGTGYRTSNLNGQYSRTPLGGLRGLWWGTFGGQQHPLRKTKMMIRRPVT